MKIVFQPFDLHDATEDEYQRLSEFKNALQREYAPDDPPILLEEHIQGWRNLPGPTAHEAYALWASANSKIVAYCEVSVPGRGENEHPANFMIEVLSEYRRQGIARQALQLIVLFAKKHHRPLLTSRTSDRIAASGLFLERLGARKGLVMGINQLKVRELDRLLVQQWLRRSESKYSEFEMQFLDGAYPDAIIDEIAALRQAIGNDQPRGDLPTEMMKITPELLRLMERNLFSTGYRRWTFLLINRANREAVGLTEVFWNPNRPMIVDQGLTGVARAYRNQGLGRWLKAEMLQKILTNHPEVKFIRTGNVSSNAPMMKINNEMGFKPYTATTIWQVKTQKIEKYLLGTRESNT
jgi:GNAT superfamily N-acetyltransferase